MKIKEHFDPSDNQFKFKMFQFFEQITDQFVDDLLLDVTVETHKKTRTNLQNRYYWGIVIRDIAKELGYDADTVHDYMKKMFLGYEEFDMPDGNTHHQLRSTTDATTISFEDFVAKIRQWASEFLNMYIPLPNETPYNYLEVK